MANSLQICVRIVRGLVAAQALMGLAACATYEPLPLTQRSALVQSLAGLHHDGVAIDRPLSVTEIARLAIENNPDLRAAYSQHDVAEAEVLQAGILPNPSLNGAVSPNVTAPQALNTAWSAGLTQDIRSLVTLHARKTAARAAAQQVDASLVWQEWQVIGKARLLAVDLIEGDKVRRILLRTRALLAESNARAQRALHEGNVTLAETTPVLVALQSTESQLDLLDQQQQSRRHDLDALLGLTPGVGVSLAPTADLPQLSPEQVKTLMAQLADHRPDLVALKLGYRAQEETLRAAVLAQFPALLLGLTGGIDNTQDYYIGPSVTMDLPIFDRNQGSIAIASATRERLHDEYAARLDAAVTEIDAMLREQPLLAAQMDRLRRELGPLAQTASNAAAAFDAGNLDERTYVDLVSTRLSKQQEIVAIERSLLERQVALATLTGAGMPPIRVPSDVTAS